MSDRHPRARRLASVVVLAGCLLAMDSLQCGQTGLVSANPSGDTGGGDATHPAVDRRGRFVAFTSSAADLVPDDTNGVMDVFVRDRKAGVTTRVSVASDGAQGDGPSNRPSISANGRFVAFASEAMNLVPGDDNRTSDVFVHDRRAGVTTRVSGAEGGDLPGLSGNGRWVAFQVDLVIGGGGDGEASEGSLIIPRVHLHDRKRGETRLVTEDFTPGELVAQSTAPSISRTGRYVAFVSNSQLLVEGDGNFVNDVFVYDRVRETLVRVSTLPDGTDANAESRAPSISPRGRHVAFQSDATDLVPGDTNGVTDVFIHALGRRVTERVSVATDGQQADGASLAPSLSAKGRVVAFQSVATNLDDAEDNIFHDVFLHDVRKGRTRYASLAFDLAQPDGASGLPALADTAKLLVYTSNATNLVDEGASGQQVYAYRVR